MVNRFDIFFLGLLPSVVMRILAAAVAWIAVVVAHPLPERVVQTTPDLLEGVDPEVVGAPALPLDLTRLPQVGNARRLEVVRYRIPPLSNFRRLKPIEAVGSLLIGVARQD